MKICARAVHVLCAGVFAATYLLDVPGEPRETWCSAAVVTGLLLLSLDLFESGAFLLQVRGLFLLAKVALLATLPVAGEAASWIVSAVVVGSVISSHAPSKVRYFVVFRRPGVRASDTRG